MLEVGTNAPTTPNIRTKTFKKEFMIAVLLTFLVDIRGPVSILQSTIDVLLAWEVNHNKVGDVESCWSPMDAESFDQPISFAVWRTYAKTYQA